MRPRACALLLALGLAGCASGAGYTKSNAAMAPAPSVDPATAQQELSEVQRVAREHQEAVALGGERCAPGELAEGRLAMGGVRDAIVQRHQRSKGAPPVDPEASYAQVRALLGQASAAFQFVADVCRVGRDQALRNREAAAGAGAETASVQPTDAAGAPTAGADPAGADPAGAWTAAASGATPPPASDEGRARRVFAEANDAFNLGSYDQARAGYEEVFRLTHSMAALFNVAQAERKQYDIDQRIERLRRARDLYERCAREAPEAELRDQAGRMAEEVSRQIRRAPRR